MNRLAQIKPFQQQMRSHNTRAVPESSPTTMDELLLQRDGQVAIDELLSRDGQIAVKKLQYDPDTYGGPHKVVRKMAEDGVVSAQALEDLRQLFDDTGGSATLVARLVSRRGKSTPDVRQFFIDESGHDTVDANEFVIVMVRHPELAADCGVDLRAGDRDSTGGYSFLACDADATQSWSLDDYFQGLADDFKFFFCAAPEEVPPPKKRAPLTKATTKRNLNKKPHGISIVTQSSLSPQTTSRFSRGSRASEARPSSHSIRRRRNHHKPSSPTRDSTELSPTTSLPARRRSSNPVEKSPLIVPPDPDRPTSI